MDVAINPLTVNSHFYRDARLAVCTDVFCSYHEVYLLI